MPRTAKSVMQSHLISVSPENRLIDVQRLFVEEEINGAPVVDETGRLVGVISATDLLRAAAEERDTAVADARYMRDDLAFSGPDWSQVPEDFQDRLAERSVSEVMTRGGVTLSPDTSVAEVAATLRHHRIHRVFICEGETPVGVISTFDLVALLEKDQEVV